MTRFVRSGGSLGYVCGKAEAWFKSIRGAQMPLGETLSVVRDAYAIADEICAILSCDLEVVITKAGRRPPAGEDLVCLHSTVERRVGEVCRQIVCDSTRWTTTSRSRWGLRLLRFVATLHFTRDLDLLHVLKIRPDDAEEHRSTQPEASPADRSALEDVSPSFGREPPQPVGPDSHALFRAALTGDASAQVAGAAYIPNDYGVDLPRLRRLATLMLGRTKQRRDIEHTFEAANPKLVKVELPPLPVPATELTETSPGGHDLGSGSFEFSSDEATGLGSEQVFPSPQWDVKAPDLDRDVDRRIGAAVVSVRRKRITVTEAGGPSLYTYGVLQDIERTFASGRSVIITGISGTGKSTTLSRLPTLGATVFEIGTGSGPIDQMRHTYRLDEFDQLIKKARRTKGRKVLICHEFFIDRNMISQIGIFDQFAFGGDPKQPGAGDATHLFDFVRQIGGRRFTLPIVWRVGHPISAMTANYVAYGSQFRLCERAGRVNGQHQFDLVECEDDPRSIGRSMVSYALDRSRAGESVIVAAASPQIVAAVKRAIARIAEFPANVRCRYLSDLQGREADVLVVDLHDAATSHPRPDEALRHVLMLLGRAHHTCCVMLGRRNMTNHRESALPVEVYFGVLLRHRVWSIEMRAVRAKGPRFESFSKEFDLIFLDEETIKVQSRKHFISPIRIIMNRSSHNAKMMSGLHCVIEAPIFFEKEPILDRAIGIIHRLQVEGIVPGLKTYTIDQIEEFLARRPMRTLGR